MVCFGRTRASARLISRARKHISLWANIRYIVYDEVLEGQRVNRLPSDRSFGKRRRLLAVVVLVGG